jgi:phosphoglycolate phosphatase
MQSFTAAVFDFDGTLAETALDFDDMKRRVVALAGNFLEDVPSPDGLPALELVDRYAELVGTEFDRDTGLEFHTRARFMIMDLELAAARSGVLFDFARPMLRGLRESGVRTAIITRNCAPAVRQVFEGVDDAVDVLVSREDAGRVKPDPQHLLTALRRLRTDPSAALMVGDHPMDVAVGLAAGTSAAGVTSGKFAEAALLEAGADFTAANAGELIARLRDQGLFPRH